MDLYKIALNFRKAIEVACEDRCFTSDVRFNNFPNGCCDDSAYLLSEYLLQIGFISKIVSETYRDGNPENTISHTWIRIDDKTIIDITGDQFQYD